jgi:hypothetical protein
MLPNSLAHTNLPDAWWTTKGKFAGYREAVLDTPMLSAVASVYEMHLSQELIFHMREFRSFDEAYFDGCFPTAVAWLLNHRDHNNSKR